MKKSKEVTIYDIAQKLHISSATVSRGLNNHFSVNRKTQKNIIETARAMGYRSNLFAKNLRHQNTRTLGVIVQTLNSSFIASVLSGIEQVANKAGYNLIISQSQESQAKEAINADRKSTRLNSSHPSISYAVFCLKKKKKNKKTKQLKKKKSKTKPKKNKKQRRTNGYRKSI